MSRFFLRINNESISQGQVRKDFPTEQAAAEFAWDDIKRGAYVYTSNDQNDIKNRWTYDSTVNGIVGQQV